MVKINKNKCIGCGSCAAICSEVFDMGKDGKAQIKKGKEKSAILCVKEAIDSCPVEAISK